jgi:flagella basal body P-ring formation protein FlgA
MIWGRAVAIVLSAFAATMALPVRADMGMAVVPNQIIYPGQEIPAFAVKEVEITNPNLAGGFASSVGQVIGMISTRTLLPGRTIQLSALRPAYTVKVGQPVRLFFNVGNMTISASGSPLDNASIGDVIKVRNLDSGITVSGTVMADGTVQVMAK